MITERDREILRKLHIEIVDNCRLCNGFGYIFSKECSCKQRFNFEYEKIRANIPLLYRKYTLEEIEKNKFKDLPKIKTYLKNIKENKKNSTGLLIAGDILVGKATVASVILMELLKRGYRNCDFMEFQYLMKELYKQTKHGYTDDDLDSRLNNAEFLVINGVNSDHCGYSENHVLENGFISVLKKRIELGYPTIITASSVNLQSGDSIRLKNELGSIFGRRFENMLSKYFIEVKLASGEKEKK